MPPLETWSEILRERAADYARAALDNIHQEFPNAVHHVMAAPGDFPSRPSQRTPIFFGSYDWHSCVEMYWLLVRLLRITPDCVPQDEIKATLGARFLPSAVEAEIRFVRHDHSLLRQRPYGWGWVLMLAEEMRASNDGDLRDWDVTLAPLAEAVTANFLEWLPKATYPVRHGVHGNSAFGLSRALAFADARAQAGDSALKEALLDAARGWYLRDPEYRGGHEPSGSDFLSPALTETELMGTILPQPEFLTWLDGFLPNLASGEPKELFTPAIVSDSGDGYIAHLHGLNASRAWCWRRLTELLPSKDRRSELATSAAEGHAAAFLPNVLAGDYHTKHWLPCYAVLMLS